MEILIYIFNIIGFINWTLASVTLIIVAIAIIKMIISEILHDKDSK